MIIKRADFIKSATKPSQYPPAESAEIAFAGRSNVGKSSLINTLVNRKRLVKTSSTPGRTQLINFFNINDTLVFVDLPGYGYARVPLAVRRTWGPMIETYLSQRPTLAGIVIILDIRRRPDEKQLLFLDWCNHYRLPQILVLTKTDKLSRTRQQASLKSVAAAMSLSPESFILFSAKTRQGKEQVWTAIEHLTESPGTPSSQPR